MIEMYLRIETWQKVEVVEHKLGMTTLYAPFLRIKFMFIERVMNWEAQLAPARMRPYDVYALERKIFRWLMRTMLSLNAPKLCLGKNSIVAAVAELNNDVRVAIRRGSRVYIRRAIGKEFV